MGSPFFMGGLPTLASSITCLFGAELVGIPFLMGSMPTLTGNFALALFIHLSETAVTLL